MNFIKPVIGQWYRGATNELFEVVAIDDEDETIELQYFDGSITEMEFDAWNAQLADDDIEIADAPEDWTGSVDIDSEDLDLQPEDHARANWTAHHAIRS
jgi:hypothetical protein